MKTLSFALITVFLFSFWFCSRQDSEAEAIKDVIDHSYINGIHNLAGREVIRQGFAEDFEMLIFRENMITKLPVENWISNVERQIEENPGPPDHLASAKYLDVDITGDAAVVKLELYREGKKLFTDYLSLYKFNDGWKIVGKTFYRH